MISTNDQMPVSYRRMLVHTAELASWPLLFAMRLLIVGNDVHWDPAITSISKKDGQAKYVIYSNHQSKLDPFLIAASFPPSAIWRLLPFRFFVSNSYLSGIVKEFIYSMGGFPAKYDDKKLYGLDCARSLLHSGQTIVIFPQAKRTLERIARRGISELAAEPDTYLIPVHLEWKRRWHCRVHIGAPFQSNDGQSPEQLMQKVYNLTEA